MSELFDRVYRKARIATVYPRYREYVASIDRNSPLHGLPTRIIGDASADPTERLTHYGAFSYWVAQKIFAHPRGAQLKVLDLGSPKMMNCIFSAVHDVTSLVLADCGDPISRVKYVRHDASDELPFRDASFDVFTSTATLPLIGLGRYGDRLDPACLPNLIRELDRVMKPDAELIISMSLGPNCLNFNNSWFFSMPAIEKLFDGWAVNDRLVDRWSAPGAQFGPAAERFTKDTSIDKMRPGEYQVIFLQLRRAQGSTSGA
jgi:SAM-dependent methyltransferase